MELQLQLYEQLPPCIGILSKYRMAIPSKSKTSSLSVEALKKIFNGNENQRVFQ